MNIDKYRKLQEMVSPNIAKKDYEDSYVDDIPVRVFNKDKENIIIYIHGGGWVSGSLNTHSSIATKLAKTLDAQVVLVGYSLAPEVKFPHSLDEISLVCKYYSNHYTNISIMGDSAGANMAFSVASINKDIKFTSVVMIYPATQTDYSSNTKYASVINNSGKSLLTKESLRSYMKMYLRNSKDYKDKRVNLLRNNWLFGFPKVVLITGMLDPLHDEGVALKNKLQRYLVNVKHLDLEGAYHGFITRPLEHKYTSKTLEFIKDSDIF